MSLERKVLLQLKGVSVHYGGVKALDGVDIDIDENRITALMGPNGAGKSTVLKAIFGLAAVCEGAIRYDHKPLQPVPYKVVQQGIAFVPQGRRVFKHLSVYENLEIGGMVIRDREQLKGQIKAMMDMFPVLREKQEEPSGSLSGGQQQMLAIARGLMMQPRVLLLDEPSLGLSPKIAKEVFAKITEINARAHTTIVVVEHNIQALLSVAHRAYLLDKGRIAASGASDEVKDSGVLEKVFFAK